MSPPDPPLEPDATPPIDDSPFPGPDPDAWDADDERRQRDCFAPPKEPCECYCLHCQRTFMSDQIWLQRVINGRDGFEGFWMCPTPNCGGAGFTFDIFPTDPNHPANAGWYDDDDHEFEDDPDDPSYEYDPGETKYVELDEELGDEDDDDIEGEEWKHGLAPGEAPPEPEWVAESRKRWEEEQKRYDAPDERPRVLDWSDRDEQSSVSEDEIPF